MTRRTERLGGEVRGRGFTLLELIIVIAVIGILATISAPNLKNIPRRAGEAVLRTDLLHMREALDLHLADKGSYPGSLDALVEEKYLRKIPVDPITKSAATWILIFEEPDPDGAAFDDAESAAGIVDVRSGAPGNSLDGTPFSEF